MVISLKASHPSATILEQHDVTWQDYVRLRDRTDIEWRKVLFLKGWLWAEMGPEGPNHASFSDLITSIFFVWAFLNPNVVLQSFGRCLIEKPDQEACAPDLILYKGANIPKWEPDEPRRIDLTHHRLPDLVGEIADTSLNLDLNEQKELYASLGIPEYWVIDVKGMLLFAFGLTAMGVYEVIPVSTVLTGLSITLVEQTLKRLTTETNMAAANWLMQQLQTDLSKES